MQCPFDASTLQVVNRSGIEIDWCPTCKGVWLERGELDKLIDQASAAMSPLPPPMPSPMESPDSPHTPPRYEAPRGQRPSPDHRLDDRLHQRADERNGDPYAGRRRDWGDDEDDWDDRRHPDDRGRRRKSLLSEIFDF